MIEFEDRVAVVTGAASGIGRALAERFAREGMKVVLADVEEAKLEAAVTDLRQQEYEAIGVLTDVSRAESVEALAAKAVAEFGKVHIVCNNAGVAGPLDGNAVWEHSAQDWAWTFGVNFWGVVNGMRTFVPLLLEHGEPAHIVNTSSIAGLIGGSAGAVYGATKHAVVRITEALYLQLKARDTNVGVSVLCPAGVDTHIMSGARNRPAEAWTPGTEPTEAELEAMRQSPSWGGLPGGQDMDGGLLPPEAVADIVFEAIAAGQFYILPHDAFDDAIRGRAEEIVSRRNPSDALQPPE